MQLDELAPVLDNIKFALTNVSDTLALVVSNQTEATTEIIEALQALKPVVPDNAVALLTAIQEAVSAISAETVTVSEQAQSLADIIPGHPTTE